MCVHNTKKKYSSFPKIGRMFLTEISSAVTAVAVDRAYMLRSLPGKVHRPPDRPGPEPCLDRHEIGLDRPVPGRHRGNSRSPRSTGTAEHLRRPLGLENKDDHR